MKIIETKEISQHDKRMKHVFEHNGRKIAIVGYDMLPHDVDNKKRISWEEFLHIITAPINNAHV